MKKVDTVPPIRTKCLGGDTMKQPEVVEQILHLGARGWKVKRISRELGVSRNTVRRYIRQQELLRQHQMRVGLRTIQYAVRNFRQKLFAEEHATVRFETPPGKQLQIDFGSVTILIGGLKQKVYFFVATLGYSRRQYVQAFSHERQHAWFTGLEGTFQHFGGVTEEVLFDNARPLVTLHNPQTREVIFNARLHAFARYWNFKPKACAPYRAKTKGKDERSVGYIKKNCIAGREFGSWQELEEHLSWWMREVADIRIHGTTGEKPIDRFCRDETKALRSVDGRAPFNQIRECHRIVQTDACVEVDTNFYSVPLHLIKQSVTVQINDLEVKILHGVDEIARHPVLTGQRQREINPHHLKGIVGIERIKKENGRREEMPSPSTLLRPLTEYEAIVG